MAITGTSRKLSRKESGQGHFEIFKNRGSRIETGDASSKQQEPFPQMRRMNKQRHWRGRTWAPSTLRSPPNIPCSCCDTADALGHAGVCESGRVRRPNSEHSEPEDGKVGQKKSVAAERGLSDSLPWQDDKTVWNVAEKGKRSDQELQEEKRGGSMGGRRQTRPSGLAMMAGPCIDSFPSLPPNYHSLLISSVTGLLPWASKNTFLSGLTEGLDWMWVVSFCMLTLATFGHTLESGHSLETVQRCYSFGAQPVSSFLPMLRVICS